MKKIIFFLLISIGWQASFASVSFDSVCYKQFKPQSSRLAVLTFRTYFDEAIGEYVGGNVAYSRSKASIPVVFESEESIEVSKVGASQYNRSWLEVVDGKITGRYIEHGTDSGNQFGRSIDYINFRTQAMVKFSFSYDACEVK